MAASKGIIKALRAEDLWPTRREKGTTDQNNGEAFEIFFCPEAGTINIEARVGGGRGDYGGG